MQELNWNNFKAKFNGKEQKSFEWLCYLLFCSEFNKYLGIFRYKNQTGIEAEPIEFDGKLIGFQAKFYETKLNENKADIKDSISKAKGKNQRLNKILIYTNQEFSESSKTAKKKPEYQKEIENHAGAIGVEIEWRGPSHFEAQIALEKNESIAAYFFSLDKSIIDLIGELTRHSEAILAPIRSRIEFKGNEIKIDRSQSIKELETALVKSSIVIVSGEAGVGKTAIIKDFYSLVADNTPIFAFMATEFNVTNINNLFNAHGHFALSDFVKELKDYDKRYIVIDSAEKLSDIEHQEIFLEFLSTMLNSNWKIILTSRYSYLDDLKFQFIEIYRVEFHTIIIYPLTEDSLTELSIKYKFDLAANKRLLELLRNPFYLDQYLRTYGSLDKDRSTSDFKILLWNSKILKSSFRKDNIHQRREECFLNIAHKRAIDGHLFVKANGCDEQALQELANDEIISYDSSAGGYFITHDIYEEWALDKVIERNFRLSNKPSTVLKEIGSSLPIRRAFRLWLSEKLFVNKEEVKSFIEEAITDTTIENYWKDEIYISVMLSDYADIFLQLFEEKLLEDNQSLLKRIIFLLRLACKGIDEELLLLFGVRSTPSPALHWLFTKPKGSGWHYVIDFIYKYRKVVGLQNINIILPLLNDWNNKNKSGETTRKASLIALYFCDEIAATGGYWYGSRRKDEDQLINVILQGASAISEELKTIFDKIISKGQTSSHDKYYEIVEAILISILNSFEVVKSLPTQVIKLADLYWFRGCEQPGDYGYHLPRVERYFGLSGKYDFDYFPASAFKTPIFQLLRFAPQETVDFILTFVNKTVDCYALSEFKDEIDEIEIFINDSYSIKQYISNRLWNAYRGTQASTCLLESIHMALEKWLLQYAQSAPKEHLESWCLNLIKHSKSASITAVVASVVLAQPSKLFNIAKILFKTKELFIYDTGRMLLDQTHKGQLLALRNSFPAIQVNKIYEDERIKACDDSHRENSLEHLAFYYQFFKSESVSEAEVEERQKSIWAIFDQYYQALPDVASETDSDKTWRLYLARMDRRKMSPEIKKKDGQTLISFNPEIDPELKKYSEESLQKGSEATQYISLKLWAQYRFKKVENEYRQYQQYEDNPQLVLSEIREIVKKLDSRIEDSFFLFNHAIPAYACPVLIRDYVERLSAEDKELCRALIIKYASAPTSVEHYSYQVSDGTEPAIISLPDLLKLFPEHRDEIKSLLLFLLFNPYPHISALASMSVLNYLWSISYNDAHAIFLGYLLLKPKYDRLREEVRKENYQNKIFQLSERDLSDRFIKAHEKELEKVVSNNITYDELGPIESIDLETLKTAFELLPIAISHEDHKKYLTAILPIFARKLLRDDDKIDHALKHRFWEKLAYFILNLPKDEIATYLKTFVDNVSSSNEMADLLAEFITVENRLNKYEEFWIVWNEFYSKIVELCKTKGSRHYTTEVLHNYLLAWPWWKEDAKEWHSLKDREKAFYKKVVDDMGHHPSVLYSISKILNDIGSNFIEDGIVWISSIVQNNSQAMPAELETNTLYYIENIARRYILLNRQKIKTSRQIKNQVIDILTFLIERGSITGYLLREDIL